MVVSAERRGGLCLWWDLGDGGVWESDGKGGGYEVMVLLG